MEKKIHNIIYIILVTGIGITVSMRRKGMQMRCWLFMGSSRSFPRSYVKGSRSGPREPFPPAGEKGFPER